MQRWYRYLLIGLTLCWSGYPSWSDAAQPISPHKTRIGGAYAYLNFPNAGVDASLYGVNIQYAINPQWSLRTGFGIAKSNLNLYGSPVVLPDLIFVEGISTLIPIRTGLTYNRRLASSPFPGGATADYRIYATAGMSFMSTLYPGIGQEQDQDTQAVYNIRTSNLGLLMGPYGAIGFAMNTRSRIPVSVDIGLLEIYYHRAFPSRLRAIEGVTYGSSVMVSISFMKRGR